MSNEDDPDGGTERESKERDIFIEGVIIGIARNLEIVKFPVIHKNDFS